MESVDNPEIPDRGETNWINHRVQYQVFIKQTNTDRQTDKTSKQCTGEARCKFNN